MTPAPGNPWLSPAPGHFIGVAPAWQTHAELSHFTDTASYAPVGHGRGTTRRLDFGDARWVLRHYQRGGLVARWLHDQYLYTGLTRTRAYREFYLLQQLHAQGLPVPAPVAYHVHRRGWLYQCDLITEHLPTATTLLDAILGQQPIDGHALGEQLRAFADAGVYHPDLNARNILIADATTFFLLDFDRGHDRARRDDWDRKILPRLRRSLQKHAPQQWSEHLWLSILAGFDPQQTPSP